MEKYDPWTDHPESGVITFLFLLTSDASHNGRLGLSTGATLFLVRFTKFCERAENNTVLLWENKYWLAVASQQSSGAIPHKTVGLIVHIR